MRELRSGSAIYVVRLEPELYRNIPEGLFATSALERTYSKDSKTRYLGITCLLPARVYF
ncbi:MAG: hypothetical protein QW266_02785 [Sulfolobales archaeon]